MYQSCFSCWLTPQPVVCSFSNPELAGRLFLEPWNSGVCSPSNPGLAVSALSQTLNWRCPLSNPRLAVSALSLEPWTGGVCSLSNPGPAVSVHSRTLIASQVVLGSLTLLVGARSSRLNLASNTK